MKKKATQENKVTKENSLFYSFERKVTTTPEFKEFWRNGQPWVNFGLDNLYPQELIRLYLDASSLHTALIRKKANMTSGNGFKIDGLNGAGLNFLANRFGNMTIDEIGLAIGFDLHLFCGFNPIKSVEEPNQLLFVKQYSPNAEYYSYCNYTSTLNYIKLAYEINVYHLKSIQNNLNSGMIIINKNGIPPAEQREKLYQELKNRYSGADAAGDILMVFAENAEKAPEFVPFPSNGSDARFKDLVEQVNTNIRLGHDA